jgi:hypothetical protein
MGLAMEPFTQLLGHLLDRGRGGGGQCPGLNGSDCIIGKLASSYRLLTHGVFIKTIGQGPIADMG